MPIIQQGTANLTAQIVPDVLVQLVPPQVQLITGVPTGRGGVVGTAVWGPVGVASPVGDYPEYVRLYGPVQARPRDMGTVVAIAVQNGGNDFRCVRVTDGTDTAAQAVIPTSALTLTSRYSGTLGNSIKASIGPGSRVGTSRVVISLPEAGFLPETFDNISGAGNELWVNMAAAINQGQFGVRGPSEIVIATAGAGTNAPAAGVNTYALTGGTDGVAGVTDAMLLGQDTSPPSGMYALRGAGCFDAVLAECVDDDTWPAQLAFGLSEGVYMLGVGPKGETPASAAAAKAAAGIDNPGMKILLGDWCYWLDNQNGQPKRLVTPQAFALGRYMTLSPEQSGLNKEVFGLVGTQRTELSRPYRSADLTLLGQAGIDVITNPVPGGSYFGLRFGRNSSSNPVTRGDNHTRLSNYLAATMEGGMGRFVGKVHTPRLREQCDVTLSSLLQALVDFEMLEAYGVICNESNNPPNRRAIGYLQADVQARYLGIVETLLLNLEGGTSVQITRKSLVPAA